MEIDLTFKSLLGDETLANLNSHYHSAYVMDRDYQIIFHNDGWERFARENNGDRILIDWSIGARVVDAIPDVLRIFYLGLYDRAFKGETVEHVYECHGARRFRKFHMFLRPMFSGRYLLIDNALMLEKDMLGVVERDGVSILSHYMKPHDNFITQCSHCRRVRDYTRPRKWDFVPSLLEKPTQSISHGLCPTCYEYYYSIDLGAEYTSENE